MEYTKTKVIGLVLVIVAALLIVFTYTQMDSAGDSGVVGDIVLESSTTTVTSTTNTTCSSCSSCAALRKGTCIGECSCGCNG